MRELAVEMEMLRDRAWISTTAQGAATESPQGTQLVGREVETAELTRLMLTGQGGLMLVGGEMGVGKTRLEWKLLQEARCRGCLWVVSLSSDPFPPLFPHLQVKEVKRAPPAGEVTDSTQKESNNLRSFYECQVSTKRHLDKSRAFHPVQLSSPFVAESSRPSRTRRGTVMTRRLLLFMFFTFCPAQYLPIPTFLGSASAQSVVFTHPKRTTTYDYYGVDQVKRTFKIEYFQPPSGGPYPLFVFMTGTNSSVPAQYTTMDVDLHIADTMASKGVVAAVVTYANNLVVDGNDCSHYALKSQHIFAPDDPTSAISRLVADSGIAQETKGIAVAGWSQGSWIAHMGKNYNPNVRAGWFMGTGIDFKYIPFFSWPITCNLAQSNVLTAARAIQGEGDEVWGSQDRPREENRQAIKDVTGICKWSYAKSCFYFWTISSNWNPARPDMGEHIYAIRPSLSMMTAL